MLTVSMIGSVSVKWFVLLSIVLLFKISKTSIGGVLNLLTIYRLSFTLMCSVI